jgi:hypothetical protein
MYYFFFNLNLKRNCNFLKEGAIFIGAGLG